MALSEYIIEMLNITKEFPGIIANDNITLQLRKGEIHALLGENGAGKSTLLRVMCGRQRPTAGTVKIGKSVRFGWLSQHLDGLSERDGWRVQEILAQYKKYYVVDGKPQSPEQMLERLGFERREFMTYVRDLSGG